MHSRDLRRPLPLVAALLARRAVCALLLASAACSGDLALDRYVAEPDPAYEYRAVREIEGQGLTAHILEMTSQRWLTAAEVDRPLWKHWVNVVVPGQVRHETALLFIGGGDNEGGPPQGVDEMFQRIALATGAVVAELRMVPNQPLVFRGDGQERSEDEMIAYAWAKFLRTRDAKWLPRLPMTKAAVRAMDTVSEYLEGQGTAVKTFVVAGGSKRGWTTWTTAAVDKRVVAIAPMVIDLLNVEPSMVHHYRAYGFWAPAIGDYEREGVMEWLGTDEFRALLAQVDPYEFRERFTMPKYLIHGAGDQFFLPDSSQFYFDQLPGERYLRYIPNTDHSLDESDALEAFVAWLDAILTGRPRPSFTWELPADGRIVVRAKDRPAKVTLWQASNPATRDFRVDTIGKTWRSTEVAGAGGVYEAAASEPPEGWTAYFLELTFDAGGRFPMKFSTPVRVIPDGLPHKSPESNRAGS